MALCVLASLLTTGFALQSGTQKNVASLQLETQTMHKWGRSKHSEVQVYGLYGPRKHYAWHLEHEILLYLQHSVWPTSSTADQPALNILTMHFEQFRKLLQKNRIEPGSIVVISERMAELSSPYASLFETGNNGKRSQLDFRCYVSGNALLHYPLLQEIIAYPSPLQIFWTEDLRCKLRPSDMPPQFGKHHRMYFVGSPCAAVAEETVHSHGAMQYFPIGLSVSDGRVAFSEPKLPENPLAEFMSEPTVMSSKRPLLFAFRGTLSNPGAKPRREALVQALTKFGNEINQIVKKGNWASLIEVPDAQSANAILLQSKSDSYQYQGYARLLADSVFTLSPAGDTYDTYRTFEAAAKGSIPVVEDISEFRECKSPAAAYRALGAPFLYVQDWKELHTALATSLAGGRASLDEWQKNLTSWYHNLGAKYKEDIRSFWENAQTKVVTEPLSWSGWVESLVTGVSPPSVADDWKCSSSSFPETTSKTHRESAEACAKTHYKACENLNKYGGCCEAVDTCQVQPQVSDFTCTGH